MWGCHREGSFPSSFCIRDAPAGECHMLNSMKCGVNYDSLLRKKWFLIFHKRKYPNHLRGSKAKPAVSFFTFQYIPECWFCPKYYTKFSSDFQFLKKGGFVLQKTKSCLVITKYTLTLVYSKKMPKDRSVYICDSYCPNWEERVTQICIFSSRIINHLLF